MLVEVEALIIREQPILVPLVQQAILQYWAQEMFIAGIAAEEDLKEVPLEVVAQVVQLIKLVLWFQEFIGGIRIKALHPL